MRNIKKLWWSSVYFGAVTFIFLVLHIDYEQTESPVLLTILSYFVAVVSYCTLFYAFSSLLFPEFKKFIIDTENVEEEPGQELKTIKTKYFLGKNEELNVFIKRFMWARDVSLFIWLTALALLGVAILFAIASHLLDVLFS